MLNRQFILVFLTFLLMCFCHKMNAQEGEVNPFELADRMELLVETDSAKLVALDSMSMDSTLSEINPFDPNNSQTNNTSTAADSTIKEAEDTGGIPTIWMGGIKDVSRRCTFWRIRCMRSVRERFCIYWVGTSKYRC